ncbi:MAG: hypothetical protein K0Q49_1603 [Haloplasmataceae bacterium]|nr:hypothetical protein [Haloplasmataceae bacterium]
MDRRKELKEQYKNMKPEMGIFILRSNFSNKCYLEETHDLKSRLNRTKFQLENGLHSNKELQKDWKEKGNSGFSIEILENLEYDKEGVKTDYSEDLLILKLIWEEKLLQTGLEFYKK